MEKTNSDITDTEHQIERGSLYTHSALSNQSARINEIESFLYAAIDVLAQKGIVSPDELKKTVEQVRQEMQENGELANPGLTLYIDNNDKNDSEEFVPVNCSERLHICKAICCKLNFPLSTKEIESGKVRWDLGKPYMIRQKKDCYCVHNNSDDNQCGIYEDRPSFCKRYSCANDSRIWNNFEKMELNQEWIDKNIQESTPFFSRSPEFTDEK